MKQTLGRFMEALGIVIVPVALLVGHVARSMYQELMVLAVGAAIFWCGHYLAKQTE
jgi:hypothetical protein